MVEAYLSLGANIGDRRAAIDAAVERLSGLPGTAVLARSSYYRTAPVGPVAQDWFLNIAVSVRTRLSRAALEEACRAIEATLGRNRAREIPWGPRRIDIDVIAMAGEAGPHHHELMRGYVIVPLAEIAPGLVIGDRTVLERSRQTDVAGVERLADPAEETSAR
jgi:2-amino-4-hydroxy-6-hydroxymethyldihydropteridine diphosphokinase